MYVYSDSSGEGSKTWAFLWNQWRVRDLKVPFLSDSTFGYCFLSLKIYSVLALHSNQKWTATDHSVMELFELGICCENLNGRFCLLVGIISVWIFSSLWRSRINGWKLPEWAEQVVCTQLLDSAFLSSETRFKFQKRMPEKLLILFLCSSLLSTCQRDESLYRNVTSLSFLFSSVWSEKGVMENDANKNDWRKVNKT